MHRREEEKMKSQKLLDNWERLKILKFFFLRTLLVLEIIAICANKVGISPVSRTYYTYFSCSSPLFSPFSLSSPSNPPLSSHFLLSFVRSFVTCSLGMYFMCVPRPFLFDLFSFLPFFLYCVRAIYRSILSNHNEKFYDYRLTTFSFPLTVC